MSPAATAPSPVDSVVTFAPAALRPRFDGWTAPKQTAFIGLLADGATVREAAQAVGMTEISAYRLRRHPNAEAFRQAWVEAREQAVNVLGEALFDRAIAGVVVPVFNQAGEKIGERRRYNDAAALAFYRLRLADFLAFESARLTRNNQPGAKQVPPGREVLLKRCAQFADITIEAVETGEQPRIG